MVAQTVQLCVDIRYGMQCVHHTEALEMRLELRVKITSISVKLSWNFGPLKQKRIFHHDND